MKRYRTITAADAAEPSKLATTIDEIEDDFEYALAGFEKLDRSGKEFSDAGAAIAMNLQTAINQAIADIADTLQEEM